MAKENTADSIPKFLGKQIATLLGILAVAAVTAIFNINAGLISFVMAAVL